MENWFKSLNNRTLITVIRQSEIFRVYINIHIERKKDFNNKTIREK